MVAAPLALVRALRPRQWLKNVLVATGPLAGGVLLAGDVWPRILLAFAVFCAAASGIYLLNDLLDIRDDRAHPTKRNRPIASGALSPRTAIVALVILLLLAVAVPIVLGVPELGLLILGYEALQVAYCLWLKHLVVIELVVVATGFLLRAVTGAVIVDVALSQWFLLVMSFGSLFMVAGKRFTERLSIGDENTETRRRLRDYSPGYLRFVWSLAAAIALVAYSLWAFELGSGSGFPWATISIFPFGTAVLRYAYNIDLGRAGTPEDTVLADSQLAALGTLWLGVFVLVVVYR